MKKILSFILGFIVVSLILGISTNTAMAADQMAATANVKVLLDNDQVRVTEANRPPGTKVSMHTHPTMFVYYFSPCKIKHTFPNGKVKVKEYKAGQIGWKPKGLTHAIEVVGTNDQHNLMIEWNKK